MTFLFARPAAPDPAGLILSFAEAHRQRTQAERRARAARASLRALLASRRPGR